MTDNPSRKESCFVLSGGADGAAIMVVAVVVAVVVGLGRFMGGSRSTVLGAVNVVVVTTTRFRGRHRLLRSAFWEFAASSVEATLQPSSSFSDIVIIYLITVRSLFLCSFEGQNSISCPPLSQTCTLLLLLVACFEACCFTFAGDSTHSCLGGHIKP